MEENEILNLQKIANQIRLNVLKGVYNAQSGHIGGSFSLADILAYLYFHEMKVDPTNPSDKNRDRFILSKGHCAPSLYSTLGLKGFFDIRLMENYRQLGSTLQGHPDMNKVPGVDMSTGSLGQGISAANGIALNAKLDKLSYRVFAAVGDGEIEEGQVWEAAMFAAHYKLDNLVEIIDNNGLQIDGKIENVMSPVPIGEKFKSFGFEVFEMDGHDFRQMEVVFQKCQKVSGKPCVIIAHTVKGKGVSFMENNPAWHGSPPNKEKYEQAYAELTKIENQLANKQTEGK